jgi:hypothetical protein
VPVSIPKDKQQSMKPGIKITLLGCGAYILTIVLAVAIVAATLLIGQPQSCSDYGDTLVLLWALLACLCLGSTAVTGVGIWRMVNNIWGGVAATAVYGLALLLSYLLLAFTLMVGFNC